MNCPNCGSSDTWADRMTDDLYPTKDGWTCSECSHHWWPEQERRKVSLSAINNDEKELKE